MIDNFKWKLYKYQSLAIADPFKRFVNYLDQKVWLAPLNSANDPFEGAFISSIPEQGTKAFNDFLVYHQKIHPTLTAERFNQELKNPEFQKAIREGARSFSQECFKNLGILCLTSCPDDIPMWAYYGNNHSGYCLEFELDFKIIQEINKISEEDMISLIQTVQDGTGPLAFKLGGFDLTFTFFKVRYARNIPTIDFNKLHALQDDFSKIKYLAENSFGVKFEEWSHEKEFRLIASMHSQDNGLLPLNTLIPYLKITGVIMGSNMIEENKRTMALLTKEYGLKLMAATCSPSDYKISIDDYNVEKPGPVDIWFVDAKNEESEAKSLQI